MAEKKKRSWLTDIIEALQGAQSEEEKKKREEEKKKKKIRRWIDLPRGAERGGGAIYE